MLFTDIGVYELAAAPTGKVIAPVLPLAGGSSGYARVKNTPHQVIFEKGVRLALEGAVTFKDEEQREQFAAAFPLDTPEV